jgi:hypothetical protein
MTKLENPKGTWEQRFNISGYLFGEEPNEFLCSQLSSPMPNLSAFEFGQSSGLLNTAPKPVAVLPILVLPSVLKLPI